MIKQILIVGTGSFIGGVSRFLSTRFIQNIFLSTFPYGTFVVNITGCFLIGMFFGITERSNIINAEWRLFLTVGFCGGFTTFSTFANENVSLLKEGMFGVFALYTGLSVVVGLLAIFFGNYLTKILFSYGN